MLLVAMRLRDRRLLLRPLAFMNGNCLDSTRLCCIPDHEEQQSHLVGGEVLDRRDAMLSRRSCRTKTKLRPWLAQRFIIVHAPAPALHPFSLRPQHDRPPFSFKNEWSGKVH